MIDTLKKHWWLIAFIIGMVGNEMRKEYAKGRLDKHIEQVTFTTPQIKIFTEDHIDDLPTPEQKAEKVKLDTRKFIMDSIYKQDAIKIRARRDTRDSLTAVTIYQIKEELKTLKQ